MSDFDFDGLRDPSPPSAGATRRAAVDARARSLRARSRMNRLALSSVSVVAVVALVVGTAASKRDDRAPDLIVGGGSTTTTTTAPVAPKSGKAYSASWVSASHGWVLETDGTIAATTDGGTTWARVGSLGGEHADKIRFADDTFGFAFKTATAGLFVTHDAGSTWTTPTTPFTDIFDLAVWNGIVYVASYDTTNASVDVWSAPVAGNEWTRHPTGIPIGAGPVPSTQLVLSGGRGWLLQVDRTVVGGAQLTSSGDWAAWTPPCASANGPAWLAASSAAYVVVSCDEHTFGGGPVESSIWFSYDGGQTFTRRSAPTSGPLASPKGRTAVVPGSQGIQRTADSGATWHGVFDTPLPASDLGFTTGTQGFVVLSNDEMLMTYDAGATWQKVTLP
jgi:photosystem II stability/assembly factor-like uncharacterized protein